METGAVVMDIFFFLNKGWDARLACDCSLALSRWRWEIWLTERRTVHSGAVGTHSVCSGCVCWSGLGWIWTGRLRPDTCMSAFFFFSPCVAQVLLQCKGTEKASDRAIRRGWRVPHSLVFGKGIFWLVITINQKNISSLWKFYQTHSPNLHFRITGLEFNNRKILPDPLP